MTNEVEIIGGGIGGLAAAIALRRTGRTVTVRERDAALPATGTALALWPAALRALDAIGVGGDVRRAGVRQRSAAFLRPDGSRIAAIDLERWRRRTGDDVVLLSRPALLAILHRAAAEAGAELRAGEPVRDGDVDAELVVAADGVFSRTRERLFGPVSRARPTGVTAWRGTLDGRRTDTAAEVWGRGVKFGVTPHEGGRTNWFASAPGTFPPGDEVARLRGMFAGWAPPVRTVLDALDGATVLRHEVFVTPALPSFTRGRVALIGDAAHAMPPDLGRGACEALIDAVALAGHVRSAAGVPEALRRYDRERRPATRRLARMAGLAARLTHVRHALPVRDRLLRTAMLAGPPG
ncbi:MULTISPECIES: FAD-dependent oxidoreductase [Catenuloplanes]|uniref:2-polyprenyl-6-methoxyphenol hydroxylase-like FAD-dependent oxidoreductase n=1 Tax=Catenuloplanes niger TaxID=587534 RepID=A0AAE4CXH5_9ACTN|nr:FAD-dependent monooxygenase [Catenuloplanes niger]MDR7328225.1 2-polyprenyl-6-methoxyphenol hydroxylase-like FAD-dependent oxidoreductase [Catenuloplanes niger]